MKYVREIDGLRALAVLLVMLQHWLGNSHWINHFNNGLIGVTFFFTLSGFLITSILLNQKEYSLTSSIYAKLKTFWIRRVLRIFPIYYFVIAILLILNFQEVRTQIIYFISYTQNYLFINNTENHGYLIHFWSLAIEEQFYIFWPLLILLVPKKRIILLLISITILGISFRFIFENNLGPFSISPANYHLLGSIDLFGYGALLAFLQLNKENSIKHYLLLILTFLGIALLFSFWNYVDHILSVGLVSFFIILIVSTFKIRLISILLGNRIIVYFGKISYGLYIYHYFMYPLNHFLHNWAINNNVRIPGLNILVFPEFDNLYLRFIHYFILVIIVASISFYFIEKPFLKLKNKFQLN